MPRGVQGVWVRVSGKEYLEASKVQDLTLTLTLTLTLYLTLTPLPETWP